MRRKNAFIFNQFSMLILVLWQDLVIMQQMSSLGLQGDGSTAEQSQDRAAGQHVSRYMLTAEVYDTAHNKSVHLLQSSV
jgi:hypothetical protein